MHARKGYYDSSSVRKKLSIDILTYHDALLLGDDDFLGLGYANLHLFCSYTPGISSQNCSKSANVTRPSPVVSAKLWTNFASDRSVSSTDNPNTSDNAM
mmetsp:Transcript_22489/g.66685  ORF Transcript_22489/g.66685 Transcript_22489/m.66685 type:complete len:99 (-) Transcript_22489:1841-2137(-)